MAEREITGRHVLIGLIIFFGVILAANGVFLYTAISTYTGVVSNEPYRKGLAYNERIAADAEQKARGWAGAFALFAQGDGLTLKLANGAGNPIGGLKIDGRLGRPATEAEDRALAFKESQPGVYLAQFEKLVEGTWQLDVAAKELTAAGDKIVWRARKRLRWPRP